jgi:hypothetical protein
MDKIAERIDVDKIDNNLLKCGQFGIILQTITLVICILCFCSSGIFAFMQKDEYDMETIATITDKPECSNTNIVNNNGKINQMINCTIKIKYNVNNVDYNTTTIINEDTYKVNDTIVIKYNKNDPRLISYKPLNYKVAGGVILCIACLGIVSLCLHLYLSQKSDWYKRYQCINMIGSVL